MSALPLHASPIDPVILEEAADWLVRIQAGEASDADLADLSRWRQRSPAHDAAWQRAESMLATFRQVPRGLGRATLARRPNTRRRQALGAGLLMLAAPGIWLAWRREGWTTWTADVRTGTGERRQVALADGTQVTLNAQTALDIRYTAAARVLVLVQGDILVQTAPDPAAPPRPFRVDTPHGTLQALGTRFSVSLHADDTRVDVTEGAVSLQPRDGGAPVIVQAGQGAVLTRHAVTSLAPADTAAWSQGMLLARNMPLAEVVAALAPYRRGVLRCDPAVARLAVSGAFPLDDVSASLRLLTQVLPVEIVERTPWWVVIRGRAPSAT